MNKVILVGRLTRDPEIRYSQGANVMAIASFSLAVDRKFKREGDPAADFFNCTAFGKIAEFAEKYLKQGIKMVVVGHIQNDSYTNRDGQKVYTTRIMVDEMEFAESKNSSEGTNTNNNNGSTSRPNPSQASATTPDGFMEVPDDMGDDELPFN